MTSEPWLHALVVLHYCLLFSICMKYVMEGRNEKKKNKRKEWKDENKEKKWKKEGSVTL